MSLPDVKIANDLMKQLENAINNANDLQKAHDLAAAALSTARAKLDNAMSEVEGLKAKFFSHLGTSENVRVSK